MLEIEDNQRNRILTRFTNNKRYFDKNNNTPMAAMFYNDKDMKNGEISVYDITEKLKNNDNETIYKFADWKIYKTHLKNRPSAKARADLKIEDIRNIKTYRENLKVYRNIFLNSTHRNIRPLSKNNAEALNIASQLARASKLHIRKINNSDVKIQQSIKNTKPNK